MPKTKSIDREEPVVEEVANALSDVGLQFLCGPPAGLSSRQYLHRCRIAGSRQFPIQGGERQPNP
jgi:hypothetical protein